MKGETIMETAITTTQGNEKQVICSFNASTMEEKKAFFNLMNNPTARTRECVNMEIALKDIYIEFIEMTNKETGEVTEAPRVVLIDADGKSYASVSYGIYNALKNILQIFGPPTYDPPLKVRPKQISRGENNIMTLEVV